MSNPPSATSMSYKGASKGKGKGVVKGKRQDYSSTLAHPHGKGFSRGKGAVSHKGKGPPKGKVSKGKGKRSNSGI